MQSDLPILSVRDDPLDHGSDDAANFLHYAVMTFCSAGGNLADIDPEVRKVFRAIEYGWGVNGEGHEGFITNVSLSDDDVADTLQDAVDGLHLLGATQVAELLAPWAEVNRVNRDHLKEILLSDPLKTEAGTTAATPQGFLQRLFGGSTEKSNVIRHRSSELPSYPVLPDMEESLALGMRFGELVAQFGHPANEPVNAWLATTTKLRRVDKDEVKAANIRAAGL